MFWLPVFLTSIFFIVGIALSPYAVIFLIPAMGTDLLFAPGSGSFIANHLTTLSVLFLLILKYGIVTKTRLRHVYDSQTT